MERCSMAAILCDVRTGGFCGFGVVFQCLCLLYNARFSTISLRFLSVTIRCAVNNLQGMTAAIHSLSRPCRFWLGRSVHSCVVCAIRVFNFSFFWRWLLFSFFLFLFSHPMLQSCAELALMRSIHGRAPPQPGQCNALRFHKNVDLVKVAPVIVIIA